MNSDKRRVSTKTGEGYAAKPQWAAQRITTISHLADSDSPCGFSFAVALLALQIGSSQNLLRDFAAACRKMSPLVEFTTRALGLEY